MAYGDLKDLTRGTVSDKISRDKKASDTDKNAKDDGYQRGLASMVYKFFDKKKLLKELLLLEINLILKIRIYLIKN